MGVRARLFALAGTCALGVACASIEGLSSSTDAGAPDAPSPTEAGAAETSADQGPIGVPDTGSDACAGVYLSSDPKNCGACGHDCLGGTCVTGICQPVIIANGVTDLEGLAIDAANVYWTDAIGGGVFSCPLAGCTGGPIPIAVSVASPTAIMSD